MLERHKNSKHNMSTLYNFYMIKRGIPFNYMGPLDFYYYLIDKFYLNLHDWKRRLKQNSAPHVFDNKRESGLWTRTRIHPELLRGRIDHSREAGLNSMAVNDGPSSPHLVRLSQSKTPKELLPVSINQLVVGASITSNWRKHTRANLEKQRRTVSALWRLVWPWLCCWCREHFPFRGHHVHVFGQHPLLLHA